MIVNDFKNRVNKHVLKSAYLEKETDFAYHILMKICMYQMSVSMDNQQNIAKLKNIPNCDILVLCEMWNCPYHNDALKTAYLRHDGLEALKNVAKSNKIWIVAGSIADKYNRCYILNSAGNIVCSYDKTHLFEFHNHQDYCEKEVFIPGNHLQCFDTPWGKCGILLCYDIRFPEVSRILAQNGAQILFCPAAFNEQATKKHWKLFTICHQDFIIIKPYKIKMIS